MNNTFLLKKQDKFSELPLSHFVTGIKLILLDLHPEFDYTWINYRTMFEMLRLAVDKAGSTDAYTVALALEGMQVTDLFGQPNTMRKDDHQLLVPFYQAKFVKGVKYDSEGTGAGWKTEITVPAADLAQPTTCKMKRPAS